MEKTRVWSPEGLPPCVSPAKDLPLETLTLEGDAGQKGLSVSIEFKKLEEELRKPQSKQGTGYRNYLSHHEKENRDRIVV